MGPAPGVAAITDDPSYLTADWVAHTVAAEGIDPAEAAEWGDDWATAATGPDPYVVGLLDRLAEDHPGHPDSPTLTGLAVLDADGRPIGLRHHGTDLEAAYAAGAPASLIADAERLAAVIGHPGDRGYLRRAIRLQHAVRAINRRLRRYSGLRRTLGTVTVTGLAPLRRLRAIATALAAAERAAHDATTSTPTHGPFRTGTDAPGHLVAAAPCRPTGPPVPGADAAP